MLFRFFINFLLLNKLEMSIIFFVSKKIKYIVNFLLSNILIIKNIKNKILIIILISIFI